MYIDDSEIAKKKAEESKKRRESRVFSNDPYPCKICGIDKHPTDFVIHRLKNYRVGKYRYLYECKECKKKRIYAKRGDKRTSVEGAISLIYKQLEGGAKKRNLTFSVTETELLNMRHQQKGKCYYTGYPMEYGFVYFKEGNFSDKTKMQISCDRLDPAKGYIKGNIVFCCTLVNKMKNILNEQEFYNICKDIIKNKK